MKSSVYKFHAPSDKCDKYHSGHYMNANPVAVANISDVSFFNHKVNTKLI